jgi:hypothetical protein
MLQPDTRRPGVIDEYDVIVNATNDHGVRAPADTPIPRGETGVKQGSMGTEQRLDARAGGSDPVDTEVSHPGN